MCTARRNRWGTSRLPTRTSTTGYVDGLTSLLSLFLSGYVCPSLYLFPTHPHFIHSLDPSQTPSQHAYTKGLSGNSSGWNGTWTVRDGYQLVGEPFIDRRCNLSFVTLPFADAVSICAQAAACAGFSFIDYDAAPAPAKMVRVGLRMGVSLWPEHEAGLQPPPMPVPGLTNNKAPTQPGIWAFDSQSTYILPNPMYSKGSRRAPFIYMGDRWDYSNTFGTSKATYVWLPLFVHPTDPGKVQVVWREEWSLNDTSVYPF